MQCTVQKIGSQRMQSSIFTGQRRLWPHNSTIMALYIRGCTDIFLQKKTPSISSPTPIKYVWVRARACVLPDVMMIFQSRPDGLPSGTFVHNIYLLCCVLSVPLGWAPSLHSSPMFTRCCAGRYRIIYQQIYNRTNTKQTRRQRWYFSFPASYLLQNLFTHSLSTQTYT